VGSDRGLELPLGKPGAGAFCLNYVPDADRQRVHVGVRHAVGEQCPELTCGLAAPSVSPDPRAEGPEAWGIRDDHVIPGLVSGLLHLADAGDYPQPAQQVGDTIRELPARGRVVDLGGGLPVRQPDAPVRCP
jgi:hypothetical protein